MPNGVFLEKLSVQNYKSIASCEVNLSELMFLVGPNGAGKSNFLDALRFVSDALRTSLDHALRDRGGINEVRRKSTGHPNHFGMRLDFVLRSGTRGHYSFRIGARPRGGYEVQHEECFLRTAGSQANVFYRVRDGTVAASVDLMPSVVTDRLYLVVASGLPAFREIYQALSRMGFYNLNPNVIRDLQSPDAGELLMRDGGNIASVVDSLRTRDPNAMKRIEEYLGKIIADIDGVDVKTLGPKETLEFRQRVQGSTHPWRFLAANMSDGTLRALGILVALFQFVRNEGPAVPLIGIEEPEVALHPAAAGVLFDALREASKVAQVLITSHSPDLLDSKDLDTDSILAVVQDAGTTKIAPVDDLGRSALKRNLLTAGELLRTDQLRPDPKAVRSAANVQLRMFEPD